MTVYSHVSGQCRQQGSSRFGKRVVAYDFVHKQDESVQDWSRGLYLLSLSLLHTSCTVTKIRPQNNRRPQRCLSAERFIRLWTRVVRAGPRSGRGARVMCDDTICIEFSCCLRPYVGHCVMCEYYTCCLSIQNRTAGFTLLKHPLY